MIRVIKIIPYLMFLLALYAYGIKVNFLFSRYDSRKDLQPPILYIRFLIYSLLAAILIYVHINLSFTLIYKVLTGGIMPSLLLFWFRDLVFIYLELIYY